MSHTVVDGTFFLDVYIEDGEDAYRVTLRKSTGEWNLIRCRKGGAPPAFRQYLSDAKRNRLLERGKQLASAYKLTGVIEW